MRYIFGFREDKTIFFNNLGQEHPGRDTLRHDPAFKAACGRLPICDAELFSLSNSIT